MNYSLFSLAVSCNFMNNYLVLWNETGMKLPILIDGT